MTTYDIRPAEQRTPIEADQPFTAFVLGGGGNLGAIQVGMLQALLERGIAPDELVGCSVGAINAAALAADPSPGGLHRLGEIWARLDADVVCPPGRLTSLLLLTRRYRFLKSNHALRRLLETALPFENIEEAAVPLSVVATALRTGREHWFDSGPVIPAVLASAALPALFPPVEIGGEPFIDGAVVNNVPISRAIAAGARRIYVLHVGNFERARPEAHRPIDALLQSFSIARNARFQAETEHPPEGVELVVLPSIDPGPLRHNDFSKSRVLIARARDAASAYLDRQERAAIRI